MRMAAKRILFFETIIPFTHSLRIFRYDILLFILTHIAGQKERLLKNRGLIVKKTS